LRCKTVSVDSTVVQADASMKAIVRRDSGDGYQQFLAELARESEIESQRAEDLRRLNRKRKGKKSSNKDWKFPTDKDARIAPMKDGRTRLADKADHVGDMVRDVIVGAELFPADAGVVQCRSTPSG
jgi:transposase